MTLPMLFGLLVLIIGTGVVLVMFKDKIDPAMRLLAVVVVVIFVFLLIAYNTGMFDSLSTVRVPRRG